MEIGTSPVQIDIAGEDRDLSQAHGKELANKKGHWMCPEVSWNVVLRVH